MKEQFVPYEIAIKLKEKGFDEPCIKVYDVLGYLQDEKIMDEWGLEKILAPLWQQVIDFLREKHKLDIYIRQHSDPEFGYEWNIEHPTNGCESETRPNWSYYDAKKHAIEHALTLI